MAEVVKVENCCNNIGDYDIPIYDAIIIPKGATNGDVLMAIFPPIKVNKPSRSGRFYDGLDYLKEFRKDWWNAPYKVKREV